jgi:endonuclease YncB( thermonuclease family)
MKLIIAILILMILLVFLFFGVITLMLLNEHRKINANGVEFVVAGTVKEIIDSNHIKVDTGKQLRDYRLAGIQRCSDKISEGQDALTRAEFCEMKAQLLLSKLVETGPVSITCKSDPQAGVVNTFDGKCLQEELLIKGLAKVNAECIAEWAQLEETTKKSKVGIWEFE